MSDCAVSRVDLADGAAVRVAARLERELLSGAPHFYAELDADVERRLSGRSAFMESSEQAAFTVAVDGAPAGRCSAVISRRWQQHHKEPASGFVGDLVVAPGALEAGVELLFEAERWLADRGVSRVYGGMSHWFVHYAVQTSGFDADPVFPMRWDPPQIAAALERAGYQRLLPVWTYAIDLHAETWRTAATRARAAQACTIRPLDKRHWDEDLATICGLLNDTFAGEWEFQPTAVAELHELYDAGKRVTDPRLLQIAEIDGRPAGVCLALPDIARAMQRLHGAKARCGWRASSASAVEPRAARSTSSGSARNTAAEASPPLSSPPYSSGSPSSA